MTITPESSPALYHLKTEDFGNPEVWDELDIEPDDFDNHTFELNSWDAVIECSEDIRTAFDSLDVVEGVSVRVTDSNGNLLYDGHPDQLPNNPPVMQEEP